MKIIFYLTILFTLLLISVSAISAQTEFSVYPQPDSPLQISNIVQRSETSVDDLGRTWESQIVDYTLQNVSDKTIRAYTLREFSREFDTDLGGIASSYKLSGGGMFMPNQLSNEQMGGSSRTLVGPDYPKMKQSSKLAIDFIVFTDGSTWGKDLSNSAQHFAGIKAGIKTILESLKKSNQQGDIESFIKTLNEMKELTPPDEQSEKWKKGFRIGSNSIKSQLKRAYETRGKKGVEVELQKLFDDYPDK